MTGGRARRAGLGLALVVVLAASAAGAGATQAAPAPVPILLYHHVATATARVAPARRGLYVPPALFQRQMTALAHAGYRAVTLDRVWSAWQGTGPPLPARPVVVSFDDGYADQYRGAFPVLRARGWRGVLNLIAHNPYGGRISAAQVRGLLAAGWELDAHSMTHQDLTTLDATGLAEEVAGSRAVLQDTFGAPVNFFAYPYGHVDDQVLEAVRAAGFLGATTTVSGVAAPDDDPGLLPRISVGPRTTPSALVARLRR